jgi:hypothetical protein
VGRGTEQFANASLLAGVEELAAEAGEFGGVAGPRRLEVAAEAGGLGIHGGRGRSGAGQGGCGWWSLVANRWSDNDEPATGGFPLLVAAALSALDALGHCCSRVAGPAGKVPASSRLWATGSLFPVHPAQISTP